MRVLVCGDRNWTHTEPIREALKTLPSDSVVIHGACKGADSLADVIASELRLKTAAFPADWDAHGKAAGPIRNAKMLREGKPDAVWAFHDDIAASSQKCTAGWTEADAVPGWGVTRGRFDAFLLELLQETP